MDIKVQTNFPQVAQALAGLQRDLADKALMRALNRTTDLAKTQMSRQIRQEFNVDTAFVNQRLRVIPARYRNGNVMLEAALDASAKRRSANVIRFVEGSVTLAQARKRAKTGTLKQLFVKIKRAGGFKPIKGAFIGNKGRTVFERVGKARLPIKPVQTIDLPQMFNAKRINAVVVKTMLTRFPDVFERELAFALSRFGK